MEQLQSHIWLTASWYIGKYIAHFLIYYRNPFLIYTVIRFVWVSAKFGTCTVMSVNGALVEDKMRRFKGECAHFSFQKWCKMQVPNLALTHTKRITVYGFANAQLWISLYMRKIRFSFFQCSCSPSPSLTLYSPFTLSDYLQTHLHSQPYWIIAAPPPSLILLYSPFTFSDYLHNPLHSQPYWIIDAPPPSLILLYSPFTFSDYLHNPLHSQPYWIIAAPPPSLILLYSHFTFSIIFRFLTPRHSPFYWIIASPPPSLTLS